MPKRILFVHPDLGIGGAERLVVDAALALKSEGNIISFVTTHHDLNHSFTETKDGSFPVTVVGDWIPRNIFGRFYALCAYMRMVYAALYVLFFYEAIPDIIFCDIVSASIPILKLTKSKIIYYCHFPDQLLSSPGSKLKHIYRAPLNWLEEKTTDSADVILVNSLFTSSVFKNTFKTIKRDPDVLYPSINTDFFKNNSSDISAISESALGTAVDFSPDRFIFLSINRYERKKNITLAISALGALKVLLSENEWKKVDLIIAGGYDNRVSENLEYYEELKQEAQQNKVEGKVHFLKSPSDLSKLTLLYRCDCLLYTPSNEHFGIVPLEAMYSQKPVIAVNSGGPTETVVNGVTGFLCSPSKEEFSRAMDKLIKDKIVAQQMGLAGKQRFTEKFSFEAFRKHLNSVVEEVSCERKSK